MSPEDPRDSEVLDRLFDGVDLIYDATAEFGIQHLLSDLAAEKKIPYICASTTLGAWGGLIVRIRPGVTEGCWVCLQGHLGNSIPEPPQDPSGIIQPMGCSDPTFTGIGCDVASIALMGARLAIATICRDIDKSYPDFPWDVAVGALREPNGQSIPLRWETFPLQKFPTCQNCAKK